MNAKLSLGKRICFTCVMLIFVAACAEGLAWFAMRHYFPKYEVIRQVLLGETSGLAQFQKAVGQPYLLYTPAPTVPDHNEQGYRGKAVPMRRRPGYARVLCLGGSTTYSWCVEKASEAYPAVLERLLNEMKPEGVEGVEVINGGLPSGTTAELLTHYLFKFHYFKPDLVLINTGCNDIHAALRSYYQPDYSHYRQTLQTPQPLGRKARLLLHSRFISLIVIDLFRSDAVAKDPLIREDFPPPTRWYPECARRECGDAPIPDADLAFLHNLEALIAEIQRDGGKVVTMAFRECPPTDPNYKKLYQYTPREKDELERNRALLRRCSEERNILYLPFPAEIISAGNWADYAHLNAAGCAEKAAYAAPTVAETLWPGSTSGK